MIHSLWPWIIFHVFVLVCLMVDLGLHRKYPQLSFRAALLWSGFWISLALLFNVGIYFIFGSEPALKFFTAYLIEESLSIDNLFVFIFIFSNFQIPEVYQRKILFWGIVGAIIMRATFILGGIALIETFSWVMPLFGLFLIFAGLHMIRQKNEGESLLKNPIVKKLLQKIPHTDESSSHFFILRDNRYLATPLFLALVAVELTDVIFALDSIPAVFAITLDPFIVYTSNIMAILGLRALFFAISGVMKLFYYLHYGLAALLVFIGIKMLVGGYFHFPIIWTLAIIATILSVSIVASLLHAKEKNS